MRRFRRVLLFCLAAAMIAAPVTAFAAETHETPIVDNDDQNEETTGREETEKTDVKPANQPVYHTGVYFVNGKWRYYKNGKYEAATGAAKRISDGKWVYVKNGVFKKSTGLVQKLTDKKWIYVKKGVFQKKTGLVKRVKDKRWYFVKKGLLVTNPKKIFLTKADKKAGRTEILAKVYARTIFDKVTTAKMSKKQKMKATFLYVADSKNYSNILSRIPYYHGMDWPIVYTNDMIREKGSTCFGFSALYGYLAKLCGCKKVYWCCQGYHAWVEIDGKVYDPIFLEVSRYKKLVYGATYARARAMNIGTDFDNSAYPSNPWMRIKVPKFK